MIATSRSLFRLDLAWKFSNTYDISKPVRYLQQYCYYKPFGWTKDARSVMDRRKRKIVIPTWRPICSQSSSKDEGLVKDVKVDAGSHVREMHYSVSACTSNAQRADEEARVIDESAESILRTKALQDNVEGRVPEVESMQSAEKHSISLELGASLMRFIKGKDGSTQKKIEEELGVKIIFPSSKEEDSIIIEGISPESLHRASEKVQMIVDEVVKSRQLDYSHFVSLPLAIHSELVDKLVKFQNCTLGISDLNQDENLDSVSDRGTSEDEDKDPQVDKAPDAAVKLKVGDDNEHVKVAITNIPVVGYPPKVSTSSALSALGIEKSIFIKPKTFHLTVLMLKLWNKDRVGAAAEVLRNVSSKVMDALDNRPVSIRLKGLECMKGSLARARVLYAPVEEIGREDRLLRACQVIIDAFVEAGLVLEKDAQQHLKLHATVMNARHRKSKKGTRKVDSFDARAIFEKYGSEEWGEYLVREVHLSQRFAYDKNGYYHCITSFPFPESMQVD